MEETTAIYAAGAGALALLLPRIRRRLALSKAKHPSLTGHSRMAKRIARQIPFYEYSEDGFFNADDAPPETVARRRDGFARLSARYDALFARSAALTASAAQHISDLQFTGNYRVPYQFSRRVRQHLKGGSFVQSASGVTLTDLDGNVFYDLTGAYGVNVLGVDA